MPDYAKQLRRAVLPRTKADYGITALIPPASQYPTTVPASRTLPFSRYGVPVLTPLTATGLDSSSVRFAINAFMVPKTNTAGAALVTAEDMACDIGSAIKDCLNGAVLILESGMKATITWLSTTPRQDPDEADAWATTVSFKADIAG